MLNRFILFACEDFYPNGGMDDEHSRHHDLFSAKDAALKWEPSCGCGSWHIYDQEELRVVLRGEYDGTQQAN